MNVSRPHSFLIFISISILGPIPRHEHQVRDGKKYVDRQKMIDGMIS